MNIDISNAHCGFRTLSVTHAWPRVARHSNPPGAPCACARLSGRACRGATGARGRAQPAVAQRRGALRGPRRRHPTGGGVSSRCRFERCASRDRGRRRRPSQGAPTRTVGFQLHVGTDRRLVARPSGDALRWRPGVGGGARRTIERCRRCPPGAALSSAAVSRHARPRSASLVASAAGAAADSRANHTRDLGSGETTRRI